MPVPSLAILIPVLARPHRVQPTLDSIRAQTPNAEVVFIASDDDELELEAIAKDGRADRVLTCQGNYAVKVNLGVRETDTDYVFLAADDLEYHRGWFDAASALDAGVVGTQDLANRRVIAGTHSTHSLVTRRYCGMGTIDDPTRLLHEGYQHEYVDDEFVETAKSRDEFEFCHDAIVEHLHPIVGKAPMDSLYAAQQARMRVGRRLFRRRRRLWCP